MSRAVFRLSRLRTPDPDCGPSPSSVLFIPAGIRRFADSFTVLPSGMSSATSALVFTAFAKIFLPCALKMEELVDERIHSIDCPIRVHAEICVPQIRVSLSHSDSDSILHTDREWRRNSAPFASSSECRMMYPSADVAFISESNCACFCEILAPPHIFREKEWHDDSRIGCKFNLYRIETFFL